MASWSDLPTDILWMLIKRLGHNDFMRFGKTCKSWRSIFLEARDLYPTKLPLHYCFPRRHTPPLLMLHCKEDSEFREFYSLFEKKIVSRILLPGIRGKWVCGSTPDCSWLAIAEIFGPGIALLNPFTGAHIPLPPVHTFWNPTRDPDQTTPNSFLNKIILSCDPSAGSGCLVLAMIGSTKSLSFCRLGDAKWAIVKDSPTALHEAIYLKDKFYAVDRWGTLISCDFDCCEPKFTVIAGPTSRPHAAKSCLVEAMGELFHVVRVYEWKDQDTTFPTTTRFEIFKLQEKEVEDKLLGERVCYLKIGEDYPHNPALLVEEKKEIKYKWVKVEDIGDSMFFLGYNHAISISTNYITNGKRNKIYFIDDNDLNSVRRRIDYYSDLVNEPCRDSGVFNLEDGKKDDCDPNATAGLFMPSVWIRPNPW